MRSALPVPPPPFRAVPPTSLHVTLAFLGSRPVGDIPRVVAALAPPPAGVLRLDEVVLLPPRRPRVMAVRLDDPEGDCRRCQAAVAEALSRAGLLDPERRDWLPHVTIGRARGGVPADVPRPRVPRLEFAPSAVTLFRSHTSPAGARYERLHVWPARSAPLS